MIILQAYGRAPSGRITVEHKTKFLCQTESSSLEQAMTPASPDETCMPAHTPSPLSADADATVTGTDIVRLAGWRIGALRSTRQDAQINYLSTLSIFMKQ